MKPAWINSTPYVISGEHLDALLPVFHALFSRFLVILFTRQKGYLPNGNFNLSLLFVVNTLLDFNNVYHKSVQLLQDTNN